MDAALEGVDPMCEKFLFLSCSGGHSPWASLRQIALAVSLVFILPVQIGLFDSGSFSLVHSAEAGIVVGNPADTVYQPDPETQIELLGRETFTDGQGITYTVEETRKTSAMCGGYTRDALGIDAPVVSPSPLPADFFSDEGEVWDTETTLTYSLPQLSPAGGLARGLASGPSFVVTMKGSAPEGAEAAIARVFQRYLFHFDDDVTIRITMKWKSMGPDTIGAASSNFTSYPYSALRTALVLDMDADDVLQSFLPLGSFPVVYDSSGAESENKVRLTRAGAKAAGLRDPHDSGEDAAIKLNTDFNFDFDPSDGIDPDAMDFELVLQHEVGHMLGFVSSVDFRKNKTESIDLFRFPTANCASTPGEFLTFSRTASKKQQGVNASSCIPFEMAPALMATGRDTGDGDQASHWKFQVIGYPGMMLPSIAAGDALIQSGLFGFEYFTNADLRAFDLIGWDYVPVDTSLGVAELSSPADQSVLVALEPTLSWLPSSNAFDYRLSIFRSSGSGIPSETVEVVNVAGLNYDVPSGLLEPNTTYLWRVEARNPYRKEVSPTWQFTTASASASLAPVAFGLFAPVGGA